MTKCPACGAMTVFRDPISCSKCGTVFDEERFRAFSALRSEYDRKLMLLPRADRKVGCPHCGRRGVFRAHVCLFCNRLLPERHVEKWISFRYREYFARVILWSMPVIVPVMALIYWYLFP